MISEPDTLNQRIAGHLLMLRQSHQWSLEQLAERSGVSRASLSRLEKGDVAATAEMLGKICNAYGITLSRLIMMTENQFEPLIKASEQLVWQDPQSGFTRRSISPPAEQLKGEMLECRIPPDGTIHYGSGPISQLEHMLFLREGGLTIHVNDVRHDLSPGDCLRYILDGPTRFHANPTLGATYILVLIP